MHRRAYEKPLGYAGDFRMMELCAAPELGGDGLYGRFLHSIAQNYTLAKTVRARQMVMKQAVRDTIEGDVGTSLFASWRSLPAPRSSCGECSRRRGG